MDVLFELRSFLKAVFLPPGLFVLLMVGALILVRTHRRALACLWAAIVLLLLTSTPIVSNWLVARLEAIHPAVPPSHLRATLVSQQAQAIVVLGGGLRLGAQEEPSNSALNRHTLERVNYAARIRRETGLDILVTGGTLAPATVSEAQVMARTLSEHYQLPTRWLESNSLNTRENARFSAALLKQAGVSRIILVTSAMHMPRSVIEFERYGLFVVAAPSGFYASGPSSWRQYVPSLNAAQGFSYAMHEWAGVLWYKLSALWS